MPEIKMPPPPPPPAPMDAPEMAEAELETAGPKASEEPSTGSKRKYRKMSRGSGAAGGHKKYKGGGLSGV